MQEHTGHGEASASIADQARAAAAGGGDDYGRLLQSLTEADPNERSAAAKELVDDLPAYETLHRALIEVGIEDAQGTPQDDEDADSPARD